MTVLQARHGVTRISKWAAAPFSNVVLMREVKAHISDQIFMLYMYILNNKFYSNLFALL